MCDFKSFLVLENGIYCPIDTDSHEEMIRRLRLKDNCKHFVRAVAIPKDANLTRFNIIIETPEDMFPDWFELNEGMINYLEQEVISELHSYIIKHPGDLVYPHRIEGKTFIFVPNSSRYCEVYGRTKIIFLGGSLRLHDDAIAEIPAVDFSIEGSICAHDRSSVEMKKQEDIEHRVRINAYNRAYVELHCNTNFLYLRDDAVAMLYSIASNISAGGSSTVILINWNRDLIQSIYVDNWARVNLMCMECEDIAKVTTIGHHGSVVDWVGNVMLGPDMKIFNQKGDN